ncbi:transcription initiation factor TFIID subunit 4-like [Falco biarmicus]|nr:transcription initiation factor TFIID subunit 4-like [Falco biarmicus]
MAHFPTPPLPPARHSGSRRRAGRAGGAPLTARWGGQGRQPFPPPQLRRRRRRKRRKGEGGGERGKKHGAASYLRCGVASAGPGAARRGGGGPSRPAPLASLCPPRPNNEPPAGLSAPGRAAPHRPPGPAACAAAVAGALLPPHPPVLLLLLAQEFLNFKEQVPSTCPPLSLGHRAWPPKSRGAASRRLASALPPESIWREGEREKGRVHEDYKVTNMAPQSLLPDHCKEMKTHFKLNHLQLTRSPCLPLPAQHPVQIFAN